MKNTDHISYHIVDIIDESLNNNSLIYFGSKIGFY